MARGCRCCATSTGRSEFGFWFLFRILSFFPSFFLFRSSSLSFFSLSFSLSPKISKKNTFWFFSLHDDHCNCSYQPHDDFFSDEFNVLEEVKKRERERERRDESRKA